MFLGPLFSFENHCECCVCLAFFNLHRLQVCIFYFHIYHSSLYVLVTSSLLFKGILGLIALLKMSSRKSSQRDHLVVVPLVVSKTLEMFQLLVIKARVIGQFETTKTRLRGELSCILEGA